MGNNDKFGSRAHLEIIPFEIDDSADGFMIFHGAPPTETKVERTPQNDHLFIYNHSVKRFEVLRYGSALIVDLLRLYEPEDPSTPASKLALFDTDGSFHDQLSLKEPLFPRETDTGIPEVRHTALFDKIVSDKPRPFTIAVDDIYVTGLAKPSD